MFLAVGDGDVNLGPALARAVADLAEEVEGAPQFDMGFGLAALGAVYLAEPAVGMRLPVEFPGSLGSGQR